MIFEKQFCSGSEYNTKTLGLEIRYIFVCQKLWGERILSLIMVTGHPWNMPLFFVWKEYKTGHSYSSYQDFNLVHKGADCHSGWYWNPELCYEWRPEKKLK